MPGFDRSPGGARAEQQRPAVRPMIQLSCRPRPVASSLLLAEASTALRPLPSGFYLRTQALESDLLGSSLGLLDPICVTIS